MNQNPYESVIEALAAMELIGYLQNEDQLVISAQKGPVWPDRSNSFWISCKQGIWYLSTWAPVAYRVPAEQDILPLCSACMALPPPAMWRVPPDIIAHFNLRELDESEFEQLLSTDDEEEE